MIKLYRQRKNQLPPPEEFSKSDNLELKELEVLEEKWEYRNEDFV